MSEVALDIREAVGVTATMQRGYALWTGWIMIFTVRGNIPRRELRIS